LTSSGGKTEKAEKNLFFLENALLFLKNAEAFCLERRSVFGKMPKRFLGACFKQFKLNSDDRSGKRVADVLPPVTH